MNARRWMAVSLHLALDAAFAGILFLLFCAWLFLVPRSRDSLRVQTWDEFGPGALRPWRRTFEAWFSREPTATTNAWSGPTVSVRIRSHSRDLDNKHALTYFVADVRVADVRCIRTRLARDTYGVGMQEPILDMLDRDDAIAAINGDYYSYQAGGLVIRNGEVYRNAPANAEACVLFHDGRMAILPPGEADTAELVRQGAWQAWTFGPSLLDAKGRARKKDGNDRYLRMKHPRTAIGYFEPGHYCFVVVDGRRPGHSNGATLRALAEIMEDLGCRAAYNLDGGFSSLLAFRGSIVNRPAEQREISDCILVKEFDP